MTELEENEVVEADDAYIGEHPTHIRCPAGIFALDDNIEAASRVRSHQESVNERLKNWNILGHAFRHDLCKHGDCFRALAVLTQLAIDRGEKLFQVDYKG